MYEHNALGYWSGLALCLTKVRSSRARCPATALIDISLQTGKLPADWLMANAMPVFKKGHKSGSQLQTDFCHLHPLQNA